MRAHRPEGPSVQRAPGGRNPEDFRIIPRRQITGNTARVWTSESPSGVNLHNTQEIKTRPFKLDAVQEVLRERLESYLANRERKQLDTVDLNFGEDYAYLIEAYDSEYPNISTVSPASEKEA